MNYKEMTRLDLVEGGTAIRQGDHFTLSFSPRDYKGEVVNLAGKNIAVVLASKKGIEFETTGVFDSVDSVIRFTVDGITNSGEMWLDITVTDPNDVAYRKKFPTSKYDGTLNLIPSTDDLNVAGVAYTTVKQFRDEFDKAVGALTKDSEVILARGDEPTLGARLNKTNAQLAETASKEEVEIERQRISNLTANAGDIDGNAELLDIRVGFDGVIYDTAGDATRALSNYMKSENESWVI